MQDFLRGLETPYVDAQTLLPLLINYKRPREAISRMIRNGELIRLKNGFYLIHEKIAQGSERVVPFELIANLLYGPSYVSMEWALSFYGMIPERVYTVTSMTLGKNKEYRTPVGDFSYSALSASSYSCGVTQKKSGDFMGSFFIASPEKALADLVFRRCKKLSKSELKEELLESKRIDPDSFRHLDRPLLEEIVQAYRSKSVHSLLDLVGVL